MVKSTFFNDEAQPYLTFQPIYKTVTTFCGIVDTISKWESKGLSNEKFTCGYAANVSVCRRLIWMKNSKVRLKFKGSCLKQEDKAVFLSQKML